MLNKQIYIGLDVLAYLKKNKGNVNYKVLAKVANTSRHYVEQIVCALRKGGLVKTKKGPGGGAIAGDYIKASAYDVIKVLLPKYLKQNSNGGHEGLILQNIYALFQKIEV